MLTPTKTDILVREQNEPADFAGMFAQAAARRWWIVTSVVVFAVASAAIAFFSPPSYRAEVVLEPTVTERGTDLMGLGSSQLGGLASLAGLALGPKDSETEEALAVLDSREFTDKFIESQHLMPKLYASKWNGATGTWKVPLEKQPTQARAYKYFKNGIRFIVRDRKAGLVTLQVQWRDRVEAAQWANELVKQLNQEMRSRAIARADASMHFLEQEIQSTTTVEGRDAISRLMEAQLKQRMLANVTPDYSFRVIDPALAPDRDDPIWPRKRLLLVGGPMSGLFVGLALAVYFGSRPRQREFPTRASSFRTPAAAPPCDT